METFKIQQCHFSTWRWKRVFQSDIKRWWITYVTLYFRSRLLTVRNVYVTLRKVITGFTALSRNPNNNISLLYYRMLAGKNICRLVANTLDPTYMISIVSQKNCDSCWLEEVTLDSPIGVYERRYFYYPELYPINAETKSYYDERLAHGLISEEWEAQILNEWPNIMRFSINGERGEIQEQEQLFNILHEISNLFQRVVVTFRTLP
ncbi:hypothetical protein V8C43DRAFT_236871 [Trichoderma afarasin]